MMEVTPLTSGLATIASILAVMALVALVETAVPLHARGRWYRAHVGPNLALTFLTFASNLVFNTVLVAGLVGFERAGLALLPRLGLGSAATIAVAVVTLDFSFYVAHRAMHASPWLWRFHAVHHSDPAVDVTTTIRQHPGESVVRYVFLAAFAVALGVPPAAFAVYRLWSVVNGLFEHANVRMPRRLDTALTLLVTTPNMHKVHHSRAIAETNSNYGNVVSLFDRMFGTFTPSVRGTQIAYGLDGYDAEAVQSAAGLLALPFRPGAAEDYMRSTA